MYKLFAAGCARLGSEQAMIKMHLAVAVAQHWFTIPMWLYQIGAINKQLMDFCDLTTMRLWMEANWLMQSPRQLFTNHATTKQGDMEHRKEVLNSMDTPPACLDCCKVPPIDAVVPEAWADLAHSTKTAHVAKYLHPPFPIKTLTFMVTNNHRHVQVALNHGWKVAVCRQHLMINLTSYSLQLHTWTELHSSHLC
jgi:hypothetical protein